MTTADNKIELEYKTGVTDKVICRLLQNNGAPVDLSGYDTVVFNITDNNSHAFAVPCTKGSTKYTDVQGGLTINFSATELVYPATYEGEFVATLNGENTIVPSNNIRYKLLVSPAIVVPT